MDGKDHESERDKAAEHAPAGKGQHEVESEYQCQPYEDCPSEGTPWDNATHRAHWIEREWRKIPFDNKLRLGVGILALVAASIAARATVGQMKAASQGLVDSRENATTQANLVRQAERAWVLFEPETSDTAEGNSAADSTVTVFARNFGRSAAYDVTYWPFPSIDCRIGKDSPQVRELMPEKDAGILPPRRLLRLKYFFKDGRKLGDRELVAFVIKYRDQFERSIRTTIFCVEAAFDYFDRENSTIRQQGHDYAD